MNTKVNEIEAAQVELLSSESARRRYSVSLEGERLKVIEEKWMGLARDNAKLPGFRKGHVSQSVMLERLGPWLEKEVTSEVLQSVVSEIVKRDALKLVSNPVVDKIQYLMNAKISFEVIFSIEPIFTVKNYAGISLKRYERPLKEEDVESELKKLLAGQDPVYLMPVEEAASEDPALWLLVNVQISGNDQAGIPPAKPGDGAEAVGAEGGNHHSMKEPVWRVQDGSVRLTEECLPFGFRETVLGMKAGQTKEAELSWDEDCPVAELQGKKGTMRVELLEVKREAPSDSSQDVWNSVEPAKLEEFRGEVRRALEMRLQRRAKGLMQDQLTAALVETNPLEISQEEIDSRCEELTERAKGILAMSGRGLTQEHEAELRVKYQIEAANDVRLSYIMREIAKKENVTVTEEDFKKQIESAPSEKDREYLLKHKADALHALWMERVFDCLISKANIEKVEV